LGLEMSEVTISCYEQIWFTKMRRTLVALARVDPIQRLTSTTACTVHGCSIFVYLFELFGAEKLLDSPCLAVSRHEKVSAHSTCQNEEQKLAFHSNKPPVYWGARSVVDKFLLDAETAPL
jgi:hypothetical protein